MSLGVTIGVTFISVCLFGLVVYLFEKETNKAIQEIDDFIQRKERQ
jgi:hypothetical protein